MRGQYKKALKILNLFMCLEDDGHTAGLKDSILEIINIYKSYDKLYKDELPEFVKFYEKIEAELERMKLESTLAMVLSLILTFTEYYLSLIKNNAELIEAYFNLSELAYKSFPEKYIDPGLPKKVMEKRLREISKGEKVAKLMLNYA